MSCNKDDQPLAVLHKKNWRVGYCFTHYVLLPAGPWTWVKWATCAEASGSVAEGVRGGCCGRN